MKSIFYICIILAALTFGLDLTTYAARSSKPFKAINVEAEKAKKCPKCGKVVKPTWKVCGYCGAKLPVPAQPAKTKADYTKYIGAFEVVEQNEGQESVVRLTILSADTAGNFKADLYAAVSDAASLITNSSPLKGKIDSKGIVKLTGLASHKVIENNEIVKTWVGDVVLTVQLRDSNTMTGTYNEKVKSGETSNETSIPLKLIKKKPNELTTLKPPTSTPTTPETPVKQADDPKPGKITKKEYPKLLGAYTGYDKNAETNQSSPVTVFVKEIDDDGFVIMQLTETSNEGGMAAKISATMTGKIDSTGLMDLKGTITAQISSMGSYGTISGRATMKLKFSSLTEIKGTYSIVWDIEGEEYPATGTISATKEEGS